MKTFNAAMIKTDIVEWIRKWFEQNGKGCNAIIGISGGKDSSVVAALCVEALGKDRVIGVLMPQHSQSDIQYSKDLVDFLGIKSYTINIGPSVDALTASMEETSDYEISNQTKVNLPSRIRMVTLYAVAQSNNGRVSNNCNLSEDWVGYSTRYGDSAGDFSPISELTVTEVRELGRELGLPSKFVEKIPIDGLCGKSDEENLGFTYDTLDNYIRTDKIDDLEVKAKIDKMHENNMFKLKLMPKFEW